MSIRDNRGFPGNGIVREIWRFWSVKIFSDYSGRFATHFFGLLISSFPTHTNTNGLPYSHYQPIEVYW